MVMEDHIIAWYCRIDDTMKDVPVHRQAKLCPSELVTLAVLFAIKGVSARVFYRWLDGNWRHLFPHLPERTRLFRLFATHQDWVDRFLAPTTFFGVADTYGIELIHPVRQGRCPHPIGRQTLSNKRWIVGGKLGFVLNARGRVCAWNCATANTHDTLAAAYAEAGRFTDAVGTQERSLAMARAEGSSAEELADFHDRLRLYRQGRPYREQR